MLSSRALSLVVRQRSAELCSVSVTTMSSVAFNHSPTKETSENLYQSAIFHLNSLQSNADLLRKIREKRHLQQQTNIPETATLLKKCGIEPVTLDRLNVIHVSGTKGKGSTCAFVESILRKVGFRTGLYTSPHLVHVRERIRINGKPISEISFAKYFFTVYNKLKRYELEDGMPFYFKFLTLLAFHVFLEETVDVAIVEVGIGGEYDSTNVIQHPVVCGVTTLDLDHTFLLGTTLPEIAWHKAGIMKNGAPLIVSPSSDDALSVMKSRALERGVELRIAPSYKSYSYAKQKISPGIAGEHQKSNMSLALQLSRVWLKRMGWEMSTFPDAKENSWQVGEAFDVPAAIVEAIESCNWRGRCQTVAKDRVTYYLDGAHTPKSLEVCSNWYSEVLEIVPTRKRVLIFHCTAERDPSTLLPYLTVSL
ncbi:CDK5 regulatory subunit associated protein 1 [Parelaphostrongylus tenuis]|uniref:tetrahydrofolate synthase n=1 Tax=Parelaphostrongylus tenuis TaxID=148309 RepID=A0AAD5N0E8_PARTN|nr:CDK5 regulatory subunit associated protein 1 [Parelaphostrongylus tenuis]